MKRPKDSMSYCLFRVVNTVLLMALSLLCIIPFLHIIAVSFSDAASTSANSVALLPKGFNWNAYIKIFNDGFLFQAYLITLERMLLGTLISMILTVSVAFPLSFDKKQFPGRKVYVIFFFFSMLFSGGIIPYYMLIKNLNLMDTIWALVVGPVPVFNAIILMNFFRTLPKGLFESARIDGASYFKVLIKIYLPLSLPSLATLSLLCLVGHWNDWFSGLIYMKSINNYPLQTYLYNSLQNVTEYLSSVGSGQDLQAPRQAVVAAQNSFYYFTDPICLPAITAPYQKWLSTWLGKRIENLLNRS